MSAYNVLEGLLLFCSLIGFPRDLKLHADTPTAQYSVTAYGPGFVEINRVRYTDNLIVTWDQVEPWDIADFDSLQVSDFERLLRLGGEVVLLGTGARQRFPHPRLTWPLAEARYGLEVMNTQAACRTFNILAGEGRRVAAALLVKD